MTETSQEPEEIPRLRWQCRRGMLELDYLFTSFLDRHYRQLEPDMRAAFVELLEYPDPVLHAWCIVGDPPENDRLAKLIRLIRHPV
ncbi:MAG: succinate dehydrogenase assembly factor 2 [Candidatus Thiodiazotropha sp.]